MYNMGHVLVGGIRTQRRSLEDVSTYLLYKPVANWGIPFREPAHLNSLRVYYMESIRYVVEVVE